MSSGSEHSYPSRKVVSTRVYESAPSVPTQQEVVSTTQTEEWTTKKKTDKLVTKQIKTRVKREIVVTEDGEILEDSGPLVTTDTTEETKTDEQEDVEHKTSGLGDPGPGWTLVPGSKVVNETKKLNTTTHETREEKNETEITEEIGGLTREDIARALKHKEVAAIKVRRDSSSTNDSKPKLQSSRSHKVVDTEEVDEVSEFKDGHVSTETRKKSNREEQFEGDSASSEDEREPVFERIEKKSWSELNADERRGSSSPAVSSGRSSTKNVKINNNRGVVVVDGDSHRSSGGSSSGRDSGGGRRDKEKVRATSPSSFNSSHLQQVDSPPTSSPQPRVYRVWTEGEAPTSNTKISSRLHSGIVKEEEEEKEDETEKRSKTFKWVENHFGSQDFEDSGIITETSGISTSGSPSFGKEYYVPVTSEVDGSTYRRLHHSKRQQMPTERKVKYKAPEPPIPPPTAKVRYEMDSSRPSSRSTTKTDGQWTTTHSSTSTPRNSSPKKQYFLGEDPGFGQRFTGMIDVCNRASVDENHLNSDSAYSTLSLTRPHQRSHKIESPQLQKCSTLGRPPDPRGKEREMVINRTLTNSKPNPGNGGMIGKRLNGAISTPNVFRSSVVDTNSPPSVTDIIHSLRSKEFLEKENSAVSIRDDDSVFDIKSVSNHHHLYHRPTTLRRQSLEVNSPAAAPPPPIITNRNRPPTSSSKQHVIKITINSDGSECSSPVNSPRIIKNGTNNYNYPSQQFDSRSENGAGLSEGRRHSTNTVGSDSIVRNAINNLMKNRMTNGNGSGSPYSSLSRTASPREGSNLTKSKVYLAASSPNVHKLVAHEPQTIKRELRFNHRPKQQYINGNNRSQSINNLSFNEEDDWSPQQPHSTNGSGGVTRLNVDNYNRNDYQNGNKRNQPKTTTQRVESNGKNEHYHRSSEWSEEYPRNYRNCNYVTYSTPARDYSPPSSPTEYTNGRHHHIKLPSPIPPPQSRSSSSPPSSPLPNLTRPFSPNYSRDYEPNNYYNSRTKTRSSTTRTPSFNSRSPSPPPPFARRPPSPVLPPRSKRASSIGDDAASSISGRSQSTNCTGSAGSRVGGNSSDVSQPGEKVVTTSRRKVTTTTTKKREIEQPDNDYYYENAITGSLNRDSNNRLNGHSQHNNSNGNGIRSQKDYISNR